MKTLLGIEVPFPPTNETYRNALPEFRDQFLHALEQSTGIERKKTLAHKNGRRAFAESEDEYMSRVLDKTNKSASFFQYIADSILENKYFTAQKMGQVKTNGT